MNARRLLPLLLLFPLGPFGARTPSELRLEPDEQNVTEGRLTGRWEWDPTVGARMGLEPRAMELEFAPEEDFLGRVSEELAAPLSKVQLFERGVATFREDGRVKSTGPYLLTTMHGNTQLLVFRERGGDPLGDLESANVFVAPGKERGDDLLLLGADFDNEPFRPFRRIREQR